MGMRMIAGIMIVVGIVLIISMSLCLAGVGLVLLMGAMPLWKAGGIKSRYY